MTARKSRRGLRKALLTMIALYGSTTAAACCRPTVCDPPPPPATAPLPTPGPSGTPMICDPPPPSATAPLPTIEASATPTQTVEASVTPMICDPAPPPATVGPSITPMICDPAPAPAVGAPAPYAAARDQLPLAEIRTVEITGGEGLSFRARTPWPGARYRWSASGGVIVEEGAAVAWEPPAEPGRYLLQVVADWGPAGLAVDALVLAVREDGSVSIG